MGYKHLDLSERLAIADYYKQGKSIQEISKLLQRHYTTIKREIIRNSDKHKVYNPVKANKLYFNRLGCKRCASKYSTGLVDRISEYLLETYSPQQIYFYFKCIKHDEMVSTSTIYRWLKKGYIVIDGIKGTKFLREKGKKRKNRQLKNKHYKNGVNIKERCQEANKRIEKGHWEIDTVLSPKGELGALVTVTDRFSRLVKAKVIKSKSAEAVEKALFNLLKNEPCFTITSDNGKEFANFEKVSQKLKCNFYFANPYASYERGTNEYHNKLLREFFPKGTIFKDIKQKAVDRAVWLINNRPCRLHNWFSRQYIHQLE